MRLEPRRQDERLARTRGIFVDRNTGPSAAISNSTPPGSRALTGPSVVSYHLNSI
jgi:hypothetical protein